ncbi:MAG TPA: phosphoribosylamine--glycine ligase [Stellaceae bacterium]|jgi:phosphoribosylamine--glycine ligase|nr:phosphoribosylamine--glycine ligase [Stellaceae bacterium]
MRVLIVGSGGREHALAWAIAASPLCDALFCAPGNPGIAEEAACVGVAATDLDGILALCRRERIDFVVVGPEAPLVAGLVDRLEAAGIAAFGPSAAAAALEGSKGFTKDLCAKYGIPTAAYGRFRDAESAAAFVHRHGAPIVVKADGLAAGKGVTVARTVEEALAAIDAALRERRFGPAGAELVIEEFLAGEEASFFAVVDGEHALPLVAAQDHKRVGEGDTGANTGGMGAYSPAPCLTPALADEVMARIIGPTIRGMAAEGRRFKGVLYAGLMLTEAGPKLIEYNVRFGDPECQVLLPRLKSDLLPALVAARDGVLDGFDLRWRDEAAICIVLAAKGYPDAPVKGSEIEGLAEAAALDPAVKIFHAGTRREGARLLADGGRVLNVVALGIDLAAARDKAYAAVDRIRWPGGFCRRDIGWRALGRR